MINQLLAYVVKINYKINVLNYYILNNIYYICV